MSKPNEDTVELAALEWLSEVGFTTEHGSVIAPDGESPERESFQDVILVDRLRSAIARLNPNLPEEAREDAPRKILRPDLPTVIQNNRAFHQRLRDGVEVEYRRDDGSIAGDKGVVARLRSGGAKWTEIEIPPIKKDARLAGDVILHLGHRSFSRNQP